MGISLKICLPNHILKFSLKFYFLWSDFSLNLKKNNVKLLSCLMFYFFENKSEDVNRWFSWRKNSRSEYLYILFFSNVLMEQFLHSFILFILILFWSAIKELNDFDTFQDLESPPSSVIAVMNNRWLSNGFKETALQTAIWSVLKAKRRLLR